MEDKKVYLEIPKFSGGNVPVAVAARVMRKDKQFVRQGIIQGLLDFGVAFKKERVPEVVRGTLSIFFQKAEKYKKGNLSYPVMTQTYKTKRSCWR